MSALSDPQAPPRLADLEPTAFVESESAAVRDFVEEHAGGTNDAHEIARRLFAAVRDGVYYDPFLYSEDPRDYTASAVLEAGRGYCVQKSVLLTAAARAAGIPSRLGFADVTNHLQSDRLRAQMGSDLFIWHAYSTLFVGGRWTKASSAFNAELCARFGVAPLDYDGHEDALLHAFSGDGSRYMEYVADRGVYDDLPFATLTSEISAAYPQLLSSPPARRPG